MNKTQNNFIPIDDPKNDFGDFLINKDNKRIFFSAKFGMGKTYFLKNFFKENKDKYEIYHLFPIRYQILNNENILEFLKYDIVLNLLKNNPDILKKSKESRLKIFGQIVGKVLREKKWDFASKISSSLPFPFSFVSAMFGMLGYVGEEKKKFEDAIPTIKNFIEKKKLKDYLIVEDYVTDFISQTNKKTNKRNVLIVDDFDRIDPEHIFRILNIFSSQMDDGDENKFGFDHIIIVADYANIKNIFHHKYGKETNFEGYFDKFFTIKPYYFNNTKAIIEEIPELLKRIKHENKEVKEIIEEDSGYIKRVLEKILIDAFKIEERINLRRLLKTINHILSKMKEKTLREYRLVNRIEEKECEFINIAIDLLIFMFEEKKYFLEVLNKIVELSETEIKHSREWDHWITFLMIKKIVGNGEWTHINWLGKYELQNSGGNLNFLKSNENESLFFYETLIEYVKKSKYK